MDNQTLLSRADHCLATADYRPQRLALWHSGLAAAVTLLSSLVNYLLTNQMDASAGLSGLELRTALRFIQSILLFLTAFALPFWQLGYTRASVLYAQNQTPVPRDLTAGFRKILPALRLMLIRGIAVAAVVMAALQLSTVVYMLTPFSLGFLEQAEALMANQTEITEEMVAQLLPTLTPVYILWALVSLGLLLPLFYRFRLADYALMDNAPGAIASLKASARQTKGRCKQLFLLDLHFWWYYGLTLLSLGLSYLDVLLPYLGISLQPDLAFWLSAVLGQLSGTVLFTCFAPKVQTAYAIFAIPESQ